MDVTVPLGKEEAVGSVGVGESSAVGVTVGDGRVDAVPLPPTSPALAEGEADGVTAKVGEKEALGLRERVGLGVLVTESLALGEPLDDWE